MCQALPGGMDSTLNVGRVNCVGLAPPSSEASAILLIKCLALSDGDQNSFSLLDSTSLTLPLSLVIKLRTRHHWFQMMISST